MEFDATDRENKIEGLRQIDDDVMQYIERKGYCKYILGENNKFIRTLTKKGYEVLASGGYENYLLKQTKETWRLWLPIVLSIFLAGLNVMQYFQNRETSKRTNELNKIVQRLDSTITVLKLRQNASDSIQRQTAMKLETADSVRRTLEERIHKLTGKAK